MSYPIIGRGKRAIVAGRTGSGKSTFGCWMLQRSPGSWVIMNPKHTSAYNSLPESTTVTSLDMRGVDQALKRHRFVVVNPTSRESDPESMDNFVMEMHETYRNVGLCCDELYSMHKSNVAGQGLLGWLTRGRELKQSFLGLTQRPAFLSMFLFSESDYICSMALALQQDRKRMYEMTGRREMATRIPEHHWLWYEAATEKLNYYGPVPLSK